MCVWEGGLIRINVPVSWDKYLHVGGGRASPDCPPVATTLYPHLRCLQHLCLIIHPPLNGLEAGKMWKFTGWRPNLMRGWGGYKLALNSASREMAPKGELLGKASDLAATLRMWEREVEGERQRDRDRDREKERERGTYHVATLTICMLWPKSSRVLPIYILWLPTTAILLGATKDKTKRRNNNNPTTKVVTVFVFALLMEKENRS